ncbi:MAG: helix-hairpin-helix domain-containing protein [Thermoanaerobaculales bacterium]|nr:helix-hairpin-helix domain-containing protein [Thermoanaerobaculales bacterium]
MKHLIPIVIVVAALIATPGAFADEASQAGKVNLNTASAEQLQLLPRVGPSLAQRIIEFRDANGAFRGVNELVAVKGIGEKSLSKILPYLSVEGETTLVKKVRLPRAKAQKNEKS